MILLRKKRITFIVFSVFLSILVFTLIKDKKEIVLNSILTDSQINQLLN